MNIDQNINKEKKIGVVFWYDDSSRFEEIKSHLRDKFGLVAAVPPSDELSPDFRNLQIELEKAAKNYLVYEDSQGIGRYRICFNPYTKRILFRYWTNRLTQEMLDKNPMLEPMNEVYEMAKPRRVTDFWPRDIEFP